MEGRLKMRCAVAPHQGPRPCCRSSLPKVRNRARSQYPRELVHLLGCSACVSFTGPDATARCEVLRSGCGGLPAVGGALQMRPSMRP